MKRLIIFFIPIFFILFISSCKKEKIISLPQVETASADEIYSTSAKVGGKISNTGGDKISEKGIYWGLKTNPEKTGTKIVIGSDSASTPDSLAGVPFYITLKNLTAGTKYYVKAFATNSVGTAYGTETFFTTQINFPQVATAPVSDLTNNSARIGGSILDDGGTGILERGVFWGDMPNTVDNGEKIIMGSGKGNFSQVVTGLSRGKKYYVRAYATNIRATVFGDEMNFSLDSKLPSVFTGSTTGVTTHEAIAAGNVDDDGGSSVTEKGFFIDTILNPQDNGIKLIAGSGIGMFSQKIENLQPSTKYYVVAYATNGVGTSYGDIDTFETLGNTPQIEVLDVSNLTRTGVNLNALVNANNLSTTVIFEYGRTSSYGDSIVAEESPVTGNTFDTVHVEISGLEMDTIYHYRIKAINEDGVTFSADSTFKTVITGYTGTVSDVDGHTYSTVGIGYQEWMAENLRTTKFNDYTDIDSIGNGTYWANATTAGYCNYDNKYANTIDEYGLLYNWYVVKTNKICPNGWHVPSSDDINKLADYLEGASIAGGKLKETGTSHWKTPNKDASDDYNFTALPGGYRAKDSTYYYQGLEGYWWLETEYSENTARYFNMKYEYGNLFQAYTNKKNGMSIRCVKNW